MKSAKTRKMARPKKPQPLPVADSTDKAVGGRVRQVRMLHNLSQAEFGEVLGIDHTALGKIERGERRLDPVSYASKISQKFGFDHTWLYTGVASNLSETNRNLLLRPLPSESSRVSRSRRSSA